MFLRIKLSEISHIRTLTEIKHLSYVSTAAYIYRKLNLLEVLLKYFYFHIPVPILLFELDLSVDIQLIPDVTFVLFSSGPFTTRRPPRCDILFLWRRCLHAKLKSNADESNWERTTTRRCICSRVYGQLERVVSICDERQREVAEVMFSVRYKTKRPGSHMKHEVWNTQKSHFYFRPFTYEPWLPSFNFKGQECICCKHLFPAASL